MSRRWDRADSGVVTSILQHMGQSSFLLFCALTLFLLFLRRILSAELRITGR